MNKNGFIFIETILVTAILTAILLVIYSNYNSVIHKEETRIKYNDFSYLYRTYYIEKFFSHFRMSKVISELNNSDSSKPYALITGFGCTYRIFVSKEDNIDFCDNLLSKFHVKNMYLAYNDLSDLQNCNNADGKCESLLQVSQQMGAYIKTLGNKGSGYQIIIEYGESKEGNSCDEEDCEYYYATISLGGFS